MPFEPTKKRFAKAIKGCVGQILHVEPYVTPSTTMMFKIESPAIIKCYDKDGRERTIRLMPTLWEVKSVKALSKILGQEMEKSVNKIDVIRAEAKTQALLKKLK